MRISDWSSDVCSSDLPPVCEGRQVRGDCPRTADIEHVLRDRRIGGVEMLARLHHDDALVLQHQAMRGEQITAGRLAAFLVQQQIDFFTDRFTVPCPDPHQRGIADRSEEHTSELQSLMRISYAVFCLKKKNTAPT